MRNAGLHVPLHSKESQIQSFISHGTSAVSPDGSFSIDYTTYVCVSLIKVAYKNSESRLYGCCSVCESKSLMKLYVHSDCSMYSAPDRNTSSLFSCHHLRMAIGTVMNNHYHRQGVLSDESIYSLLMKQMKSPETFKSGWVDISSENIDTKYGKLRLYLNPQLYQHHFFAISSMNERFQSYCFLCKSRRRCGHKAAFEDEDKINAQEIPAKISPSHTKKRVSMMPYPRI